LNIAKNRNFNNCKNKLLALLDFPNIPDLIWLKEYPLSLVVTPVKDNVLRNKKGLGFPSPCNGLSCVYFAP
jgi:hypothetical protein